MRDSLPSIPNPVPWPPDSHSDRHYERIVVHFRIGACSRDLSESSPELAEFGLIERSDVRFRDTEQ
jgi:hypothetical protein